MKLKSEVAPKGMEFKPTEFIIGGKYSTIMTVVSFPRNISPGFLSDMTNIGGVKLAISRFKDALSKRKRSNNARKNKARL